MIYRALAIPLVVLTVACCLPLALAGAGWLDSVDATRTYNDSVAFPEGGRLDIEGLSAAVELDAGAAGIVTLTQTVSVRALTPHLARLVLDSAHPGTLVATGEGASLTLADASFVHWPSFGFSRSLKVTLPADANVTLTSVAGAVNAHGLSGNLDIQVQAGAINLAGMDTTGTTVVHATNGAIQYQGSVESHALLDLETVNGAIHATVPPGTDARYDASAVNGPVRAPGSVRSSSQTASGLLGGTGSATITLRTTSGAIDLETLPRS